MNELATCEKSLPLAPGGLNANGVTKMKLLEELLNKHNLV